MAHTKEEIQQWFGFSDLSSARHHLVKAVIFDMIVKLDKDTCPTCNQKITRSDDLSIGHIKPWRKCYSREGSKELFWDLNNICFQHIGCNTIDDKTYESNSQIEIPDELKELKHRERCQIWAEEVLGGCYNTMNRRLFNNIIFDLASKLNLTTCHRCKNQIKCVDEMSLDHKINWCWAEDKDKSELFYDVNNIAFSHQTCNYSARVHMDKTSKYVGVYKTINKNNKDPKKIWKVEFREGQGKHFLGRYETEEEAAQAYDMGIVKFRNGNGVLNFPEKFEEYKQRIAEGWPENRKPKCKVCGGKHFCRGFCSKCYYKDPEIKEMRKQYVKTKEKSPE